MAFVDVRNNLYAIIAHPDDPEAVSRAAREALDKLDPERLLTTTEAAAALGIGSVNTLKLMCRRGLIKYTRHGNRTMIPLSEVERLQNDPTVRGLQASNRAHEASAELGAPEGLTPEQLDDLEAARPGHLPWKTH